MLKENSNVLPGVWPQITVLNGRMNGTAACFAVGLATNSRFERQNERHRRMFCRIFGLKWPF